MNALSISPSRYSGKLLSIILAMIFLAQIMVHHGLVELTAQPKDLPQALPLNFARVLALGESVTAAKLGILWLQAFDNQPGVSLSFRDMNYDHLVKWLRLILTLDPLAQYPLLAAARIYTFVPDLEKQKLMMEFVLTEFKRDPQRRWPWLAHIVILAKHRLNNQTLALKYARALADTPSDIDIPSWVRQAEIFLLADMGKFDSAHKLVQRLLAQGVIRSQQEIEFLSEQLTEREQQSQRTRNEEVGLP